MNTRKLAVLLFILMIFGAVAEQLFAIPAFARKYKFSCSTCHAPFPRLKPFGEEFAGRGFRMEDPSQEPARATYDVGDPMLTLLREVPLAIRMDGYLSYKENAHAESDTEFPWAFKILSGGPVSPRISYYFYYILEKGETGKLEDAYLQFNTLLGLPVNLMAGQFQVSDPLFKRELRLERSDYLIYKSHVGYSQVDLTYDRGLMFLWTLPGEIDSVFQVVNGSGIEEAEDDNFDTDSEKNMGLRFSKGWGPIRLGVYGYRGVEESPDGYENTTTYIGPDLTVDAGDNLQINVQYLKRTDDDPFFQGYEGDDYETKGGFVEVLFFPGGPDGKVAVAGLYNNIESDDLNAERESVSLTLNYLLARNGKVLLEVARDLDLESSRFSLGFVTAF
ncbi:MAG TPA: hypothetical protein PK014_05165 [Thermoanaerobaculia bacterium]|nr:hypothetical protein [Thermoanaerobaculia bacterium]HUM28787.1 hypothetical protein [Thermoanaerobaculia bacterium]HXK67963.1 hypothetical protein [Thermoanaerobaculia bacterium]